MWMLLQPPHHEPAQAEDGDEHPADAAAGEAAAVDAEVAEEPAAEYLDARDDSCVRRAAPAVSEVSVIEIAAPAVGPPTSDVRVRPSVNGAEGIPPVRPIVGRELPSLHVYMHPGRASIGEMDAERVGLQFDLRRARLFGSLGDAELAAEETVGFLIEACGPFVDVDGTRHERGVFFVEWTSRDNS